MIEKNLCLLQARDFFFNLATLTKYRILQVVSNFFIFQVFAFFGTTDAKNRSEISSRIFTEKITKVGPKIPPGPPRMGQKSRKIDRKSVPKGLEKRPATQKRSATGNGRHATAIGRVPIGPKPSRLSRVSTKASQAQFPYIKADIYCDCAN